MQEAKVTEERCDGSGDGHEEAASRIINSKV